MPEGLQGLPRLPHRLEIVGEFDRMTWVNDSISTTPESSIAALASFPGRRIVLIAGGEDRGQDHAALGRELARRRAAVVGLPDTGAGVIAAACDAGVSRARTVGVSRMDEAVAAARSLARPGTVVLLSPAAPSYNAYTDFAARGDHFSALARRG